MTDHDARVAAIRRGDLNHWLIANDEEESE